MTVAKDHPHWKRMRFKSNKVWVAVDDSGRPLSHDGKALIKYQLDQDHQYWVFPRSLRELEEAPANMAPPPGKSRNAKAHTCPKIDVDARSAIHVFTDGACSGNPGPAGIGIVMRYKDKTKEISRHIGNATNNIAELEAIRAALLSIKNKKLPVLLHTDSQYALGLLTQGWKAKQNVELVAEIRKLIPCFTCLKIIKVKGHAGHAENERADQLAVQAIEKTK